MLFFQLFEPLHLAKTQPDGKRDQTILRPSSRYRRKLRLTQRMANKLPNRIARSR